MTVKAFVRIDGYAVIARAVDEGVARGIRRALKYYAGAADDALTGQIAEHVEREVMSALCDVLDFGEPGGS